jgi:hypothetical protein
MMKQTKSHIPTKAKGKNTPMDMPNNSLNGEAPPAMTMNESGMMYDY